MKEPNDKKHGISKDGVVRGVFEIGSIAGLITVEEAVRLTTDLTPRGLDLIVQQFIQSGAEDIVTSNTGIIDFTFGPEDFFWNGYDWELTSKMDFSGVPQLYINDGNLGFYTLLISAIAGTGAQLILGKKIDNQYLKGFTTLGRRIGEGFGLGKIITSAEGLKNMPYTITGISTESLIQYSQRGGSAIDIGPIVQAGRANLNAMLVGSLIAVIAAEVLVECVEFYKYRKKKRAGLGSMEIEDHDRLDRRTGHEPR